MFHFWLNEVMPQANATEPALYAVAILASPLSASECDGAKRGREISSTQVRELTGTVASVLPSGTPTLPMPEQLVAVKLESRKNSTRGNPMGRIAGGTLDALRSIKNVPSEGNDELRQDIYSPAGAIAAGATEGFGASILASYLQLHG